MSVVICVYLDNKLLTSWTKRENLLVIKVALAFVKIEQWAFDNEISFNPNYFEPINLLYK